MGGGPGGLSEFLGLQHNTFSFSPFCIQHSFPIIANILFCSENAVLIYFQCSHGVRRERERETDRDRQRERERAGERERETETERDRERQRNTERDRERQRGKERDLK